MRADHPRRRTPRSSRSGSGWGLRSGPTAVASARARPTRSGQADLFQRSSLKDPAGLFNSSLEGKYTRAIDIHEADTIEEAALKDLIRAAVALNLTSKKKTPN